MFSRARLLVVKDAGHGAPENTPLRMTTSQLAGLDALRGIPDDLLAEIAAVSAVRAHPRDARILREGDPVEQFFVVIEGRLSVQRNGNVIAHLERGNAFGQLSLMAGIPAMVTVVVRHDSRILAVPGDLFRRALSVSSEFAASVLKRAASRVALFGAPTAGGITTILAVHSGPAGVGKTNFAVNLAVALTRESVPGTRVLLLDVADEKKRFLDVFGLGSSLPLVNLRTVEAEDRDVVKEKGSRHKAGFDMLRVAHRPDRGDDAEGVAPLLSALSKTCRFIVVDLPPVMDATIWKFLTHADLCLVLTSPASRHLDQTANLLGKLPGDVQVLVTRATADVLEDREALSARLGRRVDEFLEELVDAEKIAYMHLPESRYAAAVRRVARRLLGRLTGLALSGGAARGLVHVGVLEVLEAEGLKPDIVAGTSIGALVGSLWASGKSAKELVDLAKRTRRKDLFSILDLAIPPSSALMRGRGVDAFVRRAFGDLRFADLPLPMIVVAADIDTGEEVTFETGLVRDAVRASIAIPGVLKPSVISGRRLFDGAVVTPLPVEILRGMGCARVIAVNAIPASRSPRHAVPLSAPDPYPDGPGEDEEAIGPSSLQQFFDLTPQSIPNILDIIGRSNQYMQAEIAEAACRGASLVIRPWAPELNWMDFDSAARFIRAGGNATRTVLPALRRLWQP